MKGHYRWKGVMLGTIVGLSLVGVVTGAPAHEASDGSTVRMDNRGPGSLNRGPGSIHSGRDMANHHGRRHGADDPLIAQAGDVRQEDRRVDRQLDRREDRREDRRLERREDRREDRQFDRREDRREDRQIDRREDRHEDRRSNAGGELRGIERADHVAGDRGRDGRDQPRFMENDRHHGGERIERYQRPERVEHADRPDHSERSGRD